VIKARVSVTSAIAVFVLFFAVGGFVAGPHAAQAPLTTVDVRVHNFHQVNAFLYRGAQPDLSDLERLKAIGIKTILNLRGAGDGSDKEEREAHALGMQYVNIPLSGLRRPTEASISRILELINSRDYQPVFVHCARGSDRTGTVVAVYRIMHDGWTAKRAIKEAESFGMMFWERGMKDFIRDYEKSLITSAN
jgi:protein tyrosine/serine phosphatase